MRYDCSFVRWLILPLVLCSCEPSSRCQISTESIVIDAGSLQLRVECNPWEMTFQDEDGTRIFGEPSDSNIGPIRKIGMYLGPPPASCGQQPFLPSNSDVPAPPSERDAGWDHATELIGSTWEGDSWVGTVATTDSSRTLEVRVTPETNGEISVVVRPSVTEGVQAMGVSFEAEPDERFVGFGERSMAVDQTGLTVENYVSDGPYRAFEYEFVRLFVPACGLRERHDSTGFPIPWLLSSRGYGVLLDNDELSYHRVGSESPDAWSMEVEASELRFRVFAGPTPAEVLERFTASVGTQPDSDAPWFFGPWLQSSRDLVVEMAEADAPLSVLIATTHFLPSDTHEGQVEALKALTSDSNARGVAVLAYFAPTVCSESGNHCDSGSNPTFEEAERRDAFIENSDGDTYRYEYYITAWREVGLVDFTSSNGVAVFRTLTDLAIDIGFEGWKEDGGELTPLDAFAADGTTGSALHNRYPLDYHCGVAEATENAAMPLARIVKTGWTGSAACSPLVWGGDSQTSWDFDGLESSIYQALSMGTSGVGIWGSSIGGFFSFHDTELTGELLDRWVAFGAFSGVMRTEKLGLQWPEGIPRAQVWDEERLPVWRMYTKLRTQLYPYIQAAADHYYATGMPIMRHHVLTHPNDAEATARDDQYLFGPDMLLAPVHEKSAGVRELYLPEGTWIEWWQSVDYIEDNGSFVLGDSVEMHDGGAVVTVEAPQDEIPVFVQAGAVIPMLAPDVFTLTEHGDASSVVHMSDRDDELYLLAFPRGESSGHYFDSSTYSSAEGDGSWALELDDVRDRTVYLQAALDVLEQPFDACSVTLDGEALSDDLWDFDIVTGVLTVQYETRSGLLMVTDEDC